MARVWEVLASPLPRGRSDVGSVDRCQTPLFPPLVGGLILAPPNTYPPIKPYPTRWTSWNSMARKKDFENCWNLEDTIDTESGIKTRMQNNYEPRHLVSDDTTAARNIDNYLDRAMFFPSYTIQNQK